MNDRSRRGDHRNQPEPEDRAEQASRSVPADRVDPTGVRADVGGSEDPRAVGPRRQRYLVAPLPAELLPAGSSLAGPGLDPIDPGLLVAQLNAEPETTVHRVIGGQSRPATTWGSRAAEVTVPFPDVIVVEMDADRAGRLGELPTVHVEPDLALQYADHTPTLDDPPLVPLGADMTVRFEVRGGDGKALPDAEVYVMSSTFPVRGTTDVTGRVELAVPAAVLESVTGLYVKPRAEYWSAWHPSPDLAVGVANLVVCPSLNESFPGFPSSRQLGGWTSSVMRLDALPPTFRGHGVKVCLIDSGAAVEHPDLVDRFAGGRDLTTRTEDGWRVDTLGHGSHCAGIIGGRDDGRGIRGIAPEVELHSCKVLPGGRFSDLIEALDYCITHQIDVVNLSLAGGVPSELIARKIEQARQAGVACVAAAGNTAGPVAFPASLSNVLAVAALGKVGEFPPGSFHATRQLGTTTPEGFFSATFTAFGPEIDVVAPGVAVVSSVPPSHYAAWDGTSFAGSAVAGLAALTLAHHPDFRTWFQARDASRVDRLFAIIRASCHPLAMGEPGRSGAGLPDAVVALGLALPGQFAAPVAPGQLALAGLRAVMARAGLLQTGRAAAGGGRSGGRPQPTMPSGAGTPPASTRSELDDQGASASSNASGGTGGGAARAEAPATGQTSPAPHLSDPLAELRAALSSAGLLPAPPTTTPAPHR